MSDVNAKQLQRFRLLDGFYETTGGDSDQILEPEEVEQIGTDAGIPPADLDPTIRYLVNENLLEYAAMGGLLRMTHQGVKEIEDAKHHPQRATHHFPPVQNIINIGKMVNSAIQQGSHGSTQSQSITTNAKTDLLKLIEVIKTDFGKHPARPEDGEEISAHIKTLEAQANAQKPIMSVVSGVLGVLLEFATICAADVAAQGINHYLLTHNLLGS